MNYTSHFSKKVSTKLTSRVRVVAASVLLSFATGASADDIEIYTGIFEAEDAIGTSPKELNPNVLFILDNSGSMNRFRLQSVPDGTGTSAYDSSYDYGNDGNAADDSYLYVYDSSMNYENQYIRDEQNVCQAQRDHVAANPNAPVFYDTLIQWDAQDGGYRWRTNILTEGEAYRVTECEDDSGHHAVTTSGDLYPANCIGGNNGKKWVPCASSTPRYEASAPTRNNAKPYRNADSYNLVPGNYHDYLQSLTPVDTIDGNDAGDCENDGDLIEDNGVIIGECKLKITIMREALINSFGSFNDINVGLMEFNYNTNSSNSGGTIVKAIDNLNDATVRAAMIQGVKDIPIEGNTPLAESMYEAYRYFKGLSPEYGLASKDDNASLASGKYISPIISECQDNNIVLLSDGEPTSDSGANSEIGTLAGTNCSNCLDDMTGYMARNDMSTSIRGDNPVFTYTIGFNIDNAELLAAADAGRPPGAEAGSGYFRADDALQLESVFKAIVNQIQSVDADTFVAPAVTVNAFNRLQNREDIYYVVFKPNTNARWNGNLKKYRITSDAVIVDGDGNDAIDPITGFFKDSARSFWSDSADGPTVESGGFAEQLLTNRPLYGNLDASDDVTLISDAASQTDSAQRFYDQTVGEGIDIGAEGTGTALVANQVKIINWTLGLDVDDESGAGDDGPTNFVGDNLHGQPYVLSFGTSTADPRDLIFFTSNQGMLHAVTGEDRAGVPGGTEAWAYVPDPSLFENFGDYYNRAEEKVYGLDGAMSFLIERNPTSNALEKANLFFGQRRGGNKLFAVDVTNAVGTSGTPVSKLWTIDGGSGDFTDLAQTWAEPVVTKINYCTNTTTCDLRDVVIVAGGYDTQYDDKNASVASLSGNVAGNAIYIVDAETGDLLWMVGGEKENNTRDLQISEMTHSFPSKPTVLDVNKDGAVDIMFAVDISGQVFRIDFKASPDDDNKIYSNNNNGKVAGGMIADLSQSGADRRFYNPVDAVLLPSSTDGAPARYGLVTGSGYRAKPLEDETFGNRIFALYDLNIFEPLYDEDVDPSIDGDTNKEAFYKYAVDSSTPTVIDMDDVDTDLGLITNTITLAPNSTHKYGFYAELADTGEKILSPTLISDFRAIAVSYIPAPPEVTTGTGSDSASCTGGVGNSNAYEFNLLTGEIEKTELVKPGLTAEPVVVYVLEVDPDTGEESLKPIVIIGTEPFEGEEFDLTNLKLGKAEKRAWWERGRAN